MKTVLFINQSPNNMLGDIASAYAAAGYHCILLSGRPAPANGPFRENILLQSYNRRSVLTRLFTWMQFMMQALKWIKTQRNKIDLYFLVSNPPFILYLPLVASAAKTRIRMLVYDLYPDIFVQMQPSFVTFLPALTMAALNRKAFRHAENIYAPSQSLCRAIGRYTDKPVTTVYNWVDTSVIVPVEKPNNLFLKKHGLEEKSIVLYSGNMGKTHDVETLLAVAEALAGMEDIVFVFIGEGEGMKKVEEHIAKGAANCRLFPLQDELFLHSIACGDLAWLSYKKGFEDYSIPSKLPFFLATATPVLLVGDPTSELGRLLRENDIGYVFQNNEATAIASAVRRHLADGNPDMENRCIEYTKKHFSRTNAEAFL